MDTEQRRKITALSRCTFLPGSYAKRFVRDLSTKPDDFMLSIKQAIYLDKLFYQYRRQHGQLVDPPAPPQADQEA